MDTGSWVVVACGALIALAAASVVLLRVARLRGPISENGGTVVAGVFTFGLGLIAVTFALALAEHNILARGVSQGLLGGGLIMMVRPLFTPTARPMSERRRQQLRKWGSPPLPPVEPSEPADRSGRS